MPTYEYKCSKCEHQFEAFQSITEEPVKKCPSCGGQVKRLISGGAGLIFKGSGFYITDYKRAGEKKPSEKTEAKGEQKKESKESSASSKTPKKTSDSSTSKDKSGD